MKKIILIFIFLTSFASAKEYNHGYIGKAQFDINEERFSLFDKDGNCKYYFSDAHFHPRDFTMKGESLKTIYKTASENCIDKILTHSLPLLEHWSEDAKVRPTYYTDDKSKFYWNTISDIPTFEEYRQLSKEEKSKFVFLVNGFLHFDLGAIEAVNTTLQLYQDLPIFGFGEIFGQHDIMSDQMNPPSEINAKALEAIYQLAAKKDWVVLIHNNIANRSFRGVVKPIYQEDIENVLKKNRKTKFIWAHAGIMRNIVIDNLTEVLDEMLARNKNLYIDLSFVVLENYIMAEGLPDKDWVALIEKYPTRFLYGSDDLGSYKNFSDVKKFIPLLDALKVETAKNLAGNNLKNLLKI